MLFPFFWMLSTSLKESRETELTPPRMFPETARWSNYPEMWNRISTALAPDRNTEPADIAAWLRCTFWKPFGRCFVNSLLVALCVTGGVLFTSILAGYAFGRLEFFGHRIVFLAFMATMMIPFEVTLIPNYLTMVGLGWDDTYLALIVPWTANVFSIFMLRQFFRQIPSDFYDAALIDGCGHWRFLWRIGVPMVSPALVTVGIFSFLGSWNAFLWPLVATTNPDLSVVQKALATFSGEAGTRYHLLMAASTVVVIPIVVAYIFLQRRFIEGVTSSGIKG